MVFLLHDEIRLEIAKNITQVVKEIWNLEMSEERIYRNLVTPPDFKMGDLAFSTFEIAKNLKKSPAEIALTLLQNLKFTHFGSTAKALGPYLNITLSVDNIFSYLESEINSDHFFKKKITKDAPKTMLEYSQPNTHKELHVGHMRNLCVGNALIKILRFANFEVISSTFPGDVGTHVAKCLWYLKKHNKETPPKERKGAWLGRMYSLAHNKLEDEKETQNFQKNKEELTLILKELERKEGEYFDLWQETRQWSIDLMNDVYKWANVNFDVWYWESEVDSSSVKLIMDYYEKGVFVKDDGAIGCDLSEEKLGFCLLIKRDGNGLYATKDIELARRKFQDFKIEKNLYLVDKRQERHFKQVFATLKKMGFENADNCEHIQYDFVELPDGAMSSRKGNIVPLQDLIDQMESMIKDKYLSKYSGDWEEEEINNTAHIIAEGAIKFGMTRIDNNKKIVFDMNEWLKLDGDSGPYIQYVYARINSLLRKNNFKEKETNSTLLTHSLEHDLILKLMEFNNTVELSAKNYKTSAMTSYLYELSKLFNAFYVECPIGKAQTEDLKEVRLSLAFLVSKVLKNGLALLGVRVPERM